MKFEYKFENTTINTIDANGMALSRRRKGVGITLHVEEGIPKSAEVFDLATGGGDEYAIIGLVVEDGELVGYDGVFDIPKDLLAVLEKHGIRNGLGI